MKRLLSAIIIACLLATSFSTVLAAENDIVLAKFLFVSPTGSDDADGTLKAPFQTIEKALEVANTIDSKVVINLRGGTYSVSDTIHLNSLTYGKCYDNIVLRGTPGESVTITAGKTIPFSSFSKVTDTNFLDKLSDQTKRDSIYSVSLPSVGITDYGEIKIQGMGMGNADASVLGYAPTLSYNDTSLQMARYPNSGYLLTETAVFDGMTGDGYYGDLGRAEFTTTDKRYNSWAKKDVWAAGYFRHDWADSTAPCDFNTATDTIYTYVTKAYGLTENRRFYFFNVPEEIDIPGEWYLDRETGILYLYPTEEMKNTDSLLFSSSTNTILNLLNTSNFSIENIKFEGTCDKGLYIANCDNVKIYCCEFSSIGNTAVYIYKSTNSGVDCSHFHDIGSIGITIDACGDRETLTASNCYVTNTEIERFQNYKRTYGPAISIINYTVGSHIAHNKIHNAPHYAISYLGNDNIIEYNDIYDVCKETRDCGAVYTGRNWSTWGNIFRYNYVHDMNIDSTSTTSFGVHGIYLDDMSSQTDVYGNVFANIPSAGLIGGGRNNRFVNNLMINCDAGLRYDQRAANDYDPNATHHEQYTYNGVTKGYSWGVTTCFESLLNAKNSNGELLYKTEAWTSKYTGYSQWPNSAQQYMLEDDPEIPKYATVKNNVIYNKTLANGKSTIDEKVKVSTYSDIQSDVRILLSSYFADYSGKDYTLTDAGLKKIRNSAPDFEAIDFRSIGQTAYIYESNYVSDEASFMSTGAQQSAYFSYTKGEENIVSKHALYAYAKFSCDSNNIAETGFNITNSKGISINCPIHTIPTGDAFAVRVVGAGLVADTYTVQPYLNTKDGRNILGEEQSIVIKPAILAGVESGEADVTIYEIESFK